MTRLMPLLVTLFAALALALPASRAAAKDGLDSVLTAKVLPGWRMQSGVHVAGLALTLEPGWKTYWRVPGEAGIPPKFTWRGSGNLAGIEVVWPTPIVFDQLGTQSVGYKGRVVLPLRLRAQDARAPVRLRGKVVMGVCRDICIPVSFKIDTTLAPAGTRDAAIVAALVDRPLSAREAGVRSATCRIRPIEGGVRVDAQLALPPTGTKEAVVIEAADPQLYIGQAKTARDGDTLSASAKVYHVDGGAFALSREALRFTVIGSRHAADIAGCSAG
ncbi:protein-disulfide reductase DsbD domain-containing protein [Pseudaestuariivita sp.]|uniref:protein-disulfide reductase DsbD domain-containing protein n=1 Tax=Pseudaestuariivita sp. TaxID=2211669 RepID=UPI0040589AD5